ncbi:MAG: SpoIIE family protein phosphatase [Bacteroidales bacterium]|nr:SpoIIE family protein phosphatase [Bacteroidales bacterium]
MVAEDESFEAMFAEEDTTQKQDTGNEDSWKILIVDDEEDIHTVIKLALDGFIFENKKITFLDAYSASQGETVLAKNKDIAVILLDVVMETDHAGLNLVKHIREALGNQFIRIVLWTGQPGHAPKKEVVLSYEINDYKTKTDLTDENIFTAVLASIRSYNAMMTVESFRQNLEVMVKERTKTIETQKNKITDSITYAQKIQKSMLPSDKLIKKYFPESFIFYRPKDIVSGDFYWFAEPELDEWGKETDKLFIAAADCTGHGVPGAFMSMIGNTLLNEIVNGKKIFEPSHILDELNKGVISALNQKTNKEDAQNDGMDITVCQIDPTQKKLYISCASHVIFIADKSNINMLEGDIYSIGGMFSVLQDPVFTTHEIDYTEDTTIYMFSDGFQDQFGGSENQKFMLGRFKETLKNTCHLPMQEQLEKLQAAFENWKGEYRQIDDILVMGIKFNNVHSKN